MIVCICKNISEAKIIAEARNGTCSLDDLKAKFGVATNCGSCSELAQQILVENQTPIAAQQLYTRLAL